MRLAAGTLLAGSAPFALAAEGGSILEEVIVTAQRTEESVQDVPIAVTALSGQLLEDRQIINPSDLQMNAPNVSFTATNFGSSSFSIRGIGRLVTAASGEAGVSIHLNEIPIPTNLPAAEFYDMERVEILRGPQGTLYGRNATGGVVNLITAMPTYDEFDGFVDVEVGDYSHRRVKGAVNMPLSDAMGLRVAGMWLERDGYTDNLAAGQGVPGVDDDLDGRDMQSYRMTWSWDFTERDSLWVQYSRFDENSDRTRITNQICAKNDLPTSGCVPDGFGFDGVHTGSTTGGIFAMLVGAVPLGAGTTADGLVFPFERPAGIGLRAQHTDFEPKYSFQEDTVTFGYEHNFDNFTLSVIGGTQDTEYLSMQDYNMDVGASLNQRALAGDPTFVAFNTDAFYANGGVAGSPLALGLVPLGDFPTSDTRGGFADPNCVLNAGTYGVEGGCIAPFAARDRIYSYDQSDSKARYKTIEARLQSAFDGRFNFLLGGMAYDGQSSGNYFVNANSLDIVTSYGAPAPPLGLPPLYPGVFDSHSSGPGYETDGYSIFGEVYFDVTDDIKLTAGLRYNEDNKKVRDAGYLYNSIDLNAVCAGLTGEATCAAFGYNGGAGLSEQTWIRTPLVSEGALLVAPGTPLSFFPATAGLLDFYGLTSQWEAGVTPQDLLDVAQQIPLVPSNGEARALTGSADDDTWDEVTGRIGIDWQLTDDILLYGFYTKGYKPGGFNPPINPEFQATTPFTFDQEEVDSYEIGAKTVLLDGSMIFNATAFFYDYSGLQIASIQNNTAVNQNIDSENWGVEIESYWKPDFAPRLALDFSYSYLSTEIDGGTLLLDTVDRTQGSADVTLLKNIDSGSNTGVNFIANTADLLAILPAADVAGGALTPTNSAVVASAIYPNGIPAYWSRNFIESEFAANNIPGIACPVTGDLSGACDGLLADLGGNSLPNSPEHTVKLGAAWTFDVPTGSLTARWDYYWQDDSFSREYNRPGDKIDSWDQHNASLIYESNDGRWLVRAWVRNLQDEDNVTGHYMTSDTSGLFRNYFLTEPRIYGASLRVAF